MLKIVHVEGSLASSSLQSSSGIKGPEQKSAEQCVGGRRVVPRFAAIDLGTNNCRLMVAERAGDGFRVVEAYSRIVRLGEGVATTGRLAEAAVDRAIEALRICAGKIHRLGVAHAWHVATEACRRASNCDEFLDRVEAETGIRLEIISTEQEARLALAGCVH